MKKLIVLTSFFLCLSMQSYGQLKLTINGFVDNNNESNDYVVANFENISQDRLYADVLKFINKSYKSPKDVINEVKPEMITISGFQPSCISLTKVKSFLGKKTSLTGGFDMQYNISVQIKDGKIRMDAPTFECTQNNSGRITRLVMTGSNGGLGTEVRTALFKKDGKPSRENAISMIEDFFNTFFNEMVKYINDSNSAKSDW